MKENTRESAGNEITVWEVAKVLQGPVDGFSDTYEMHNVTIRRHLLNGDLGDARDQTVLLFLDTARFLGRTIEDAAELSRFCSKVVAAIACDRLPDTAINRVIEKLETQFE
jgi:hypothetical protein